MMMIFALIGHLSITVSFFAGLAWFATYLLERPPAFFPDIAIGALIVAVSCWVIAFVFFFIDIKRWF